MGKIKKIRRVKLLINRLSGEAVAMKMVDLKKHPDAVASVKKEVCIQKILAHPNILKFFGKRTQGTVEYIFLEYAAGGELFDRIGESRGTIRCNGSIIFLPLFDNLQSPMLAWRLKPRNVTFCRFCRALSTCIRAVSPIGT